MDDLPPPLSRLLRQVKAGKSDWKLAKLADTVHVVKAYKTSDPVAAWEEIREELLKLKGEEEAEVEIPEEVWLHKEVRKGEVDVEKYEGEVEELLLEVGEDRAVQISVGENCLHVKEAGEVDGDTRETRQILWDGAGNVIFPDLGMGFQVPHPIPANISVLAHLADSSHLPHDLPSTVTDYITVRSPGYTPTLIELTFAAAVTDPWKISADSTKITWQDLYTAYTQCDEADLRTILTTDENFRSQLYAYPVGGLVEVNMENIGWVKGYVTDIQEEPIEGEDGGVLEYTVELLNGRVFEGVGERWLRPKIVHVERRRDLKKLRGEERVTHVNSLPVRKFEKHCLKVEDGDVDWWVRIEGSPEVKETSEVHDRMSLGVEAVRVRSGEKPELDGVYKRVDCEGDVTEWVRGDVRITPLTGWWTVVDSGNEHTLRSKRKISKLPPPQTPYSTPKWLVSDEVAYHSDWVSAPFTQIFTSDVVVKKHPQAHLNLEFAATDDLTITTTPPSLSPLEGRRVWYVNGTKVKTVQDVRAEVAGKKYVAMRLKPPPAPVEDTGRRRRVGVVLSDDEEE